MATAFKEYMKFPGAGKKISRDFDFGDLSSGQICNLTIIRQREKVRVLFIAKVCVGVWYLSQYFLIL